MDTNDKVLARTVVPVPAAGFVCARARVLLRQPEKGLAFTRAVMALPHGEWAFRRGQLFIRLEGMRSLARVLGVVGLGFEEMPNGEVRNAKWEAGRSCLPPRDRE